MVRAFDQISAVKECQGRARTWVLAGSVILTTAACFSLAWALPSYTHSCHPTPFLLLPFEYFQCLQSGHGATVDGKSQAVLPTHNIFQPEKPSVAASGSVK